MEQMLTDFSCFEFLSRINTIVFNCYYCNHGFTPSQGNFPKFTSTTSHAEAVARKCSIKKMFFKKYRRILRKINVMESPF